MTMVTMLSEKNDRIDQQVMFGIGFFFFAAYVFSLFVLHLAPSSWLWTYLGFLVPILFWSSAKKKMAVLVGFLTGTVTGIAVVAALILYVLTHWGGC